MENIIYLIKRSEFLSKFTQLVSGTTIAQVLPLIAAPVLARIYTPLDFGLFAYFISIVGILGIIANGRYEYSFSVHKKAIELKHIFNLCLVINISLSSLILTVVVILNYLSFHSDNFLFFIEHYGFLIPFGVFLYGVNQAYILLYNRQNRFKKIAVGKVIQGVGIAIFSVAFYKLESGLVLGWITGYLFADLYFINSYSLIQKKISLKKIIQLAKKYDRFLKLDLISSLLNSASLQIPNFLIGYFFGTYYTGQYSQAFRLLQVPITFIGYSVGQTFLNQSAIRLRGGNFKEIESLFFKLFFVLAVLGGVPFLAIYLGGDTIFKFVLGKEWEMSGLIASTFSIWLWYAFTTSHINYLFVVLERQDLNLKLNLSLFVFRALSLIIGAYYITDFMDLMWLYGIGSFLTLFILGFWGLYSIEFKRKKAFLYVGFFFLFLMIVKIIF